jgi:hypothetical protein
MTYNGNNGKHSRQQGRVARSPMAQPVAAADPCSAGAPHCRLSFGVMRMSRTLPENRDVPLLLKTEFSHARTLQPNATWMTWS